MSQSPPSSSIIEPGRSAARWVEVAEQVLACARMFRNHLSRQIGRRELSQPEFAVLWACRRAPCAGLSQTQLAAVLATSAAQVSGLVEKLRCRGLLHGRRSRPDRRRRLWKLTPVGQTRLQAALADLADWAAALDQGLGADGSGELAHLLERLGEALNRRGCCPGWHKAPLEPLQTFRHAADRKGAA